MDRRLWRLLLAPGRGIGRLVTARCLLAMKGRYPTVLGFAMLFRRSRFFGQMLDTTFGGFREKA